MSRADGTPVNAVYGFTSMLMKLRDDTDADYVAVIFDAGRKTFRNDIYPEYKAHRPEPPDDLIPQFKLVRDAVKAMNIACVEKPGMEADDLIATYTRIAREKGAKVTIVSSDKDLMQLVHDGSVVLYDAMKNKEITSKEVEERFGVGPDKVIDIQSLAGDSSDNVPGIRGIGVKTAAELIKTYGDLDTLLARAGEIKQPKRRQSLLEGAEMARISRKLVTLRDDCELEEPLESFAVRKLDGPMLLKFLEEQSFKSLASRVVSRGLGGAVTSGAPAPKAEVTGAAAVVTPGGTAVAIEVPQPSYSLVRTPAELDVWIAEGFRLGTVAVEVKTSEAHAMRGKLCGIALAVDGGKGCYIPLAHRGGAAQGSFDLGDGGEGGGGLLPKQIPMAEALARLKPLLEDPGVLKVGQDIKFAVEVLARNGITVGPVDDTMLLSYVLEGGLHAHDIADLAPMLLDRNPIALKDIVGSGKAQVSFDLVDPEKARDYAAEGAEVAIRLYSILKPRLVADRMTTVYETLERPLIQVLSDMERRGIRVDPKALQALSDDWEKRIATLEKQIHKLAGREFTIGSPKQLGEILFDEMGLEGGKKGKTGAYGTGADILEELAAQGHDLPARVLDWRQLTKLKSTYTDSLLNEIHPETGRVHTSYAMAVASTGRLSSNDPNLQNIPIRTDEGRRIREAFVADKGYKLMSADYSQIELRLLAHVAGIDALKKAFKEGEDIHAMTASQVFGVPVKGMDPMIRRQAKAINFGIIYGISAFGLGRQLGIPNSEAGEYIKAYFSRYPGIRDYMERTKEIARQKGYVTTLYGRKCHVPGIKDKNPAMRNFSERAAINAPIQGGAADVIKRAMVRLPAALATAGLKARMLLQVHDELVFEVPSAEVDATKTLVGKVMESAAHLDVPLVVETGVGDSWASAH
jgi:DNA polymerase-1